MKKIAIYETDVQNDFSLKNGALFVHGFEKYSTWKEFGAEARLPNIKAIHGFAKENKYQILGSVDRHFYEDAELIRNKGGAFDDHCMNGTQGQLRIDGLERQMDIYIQKKEGPHLDNRNFSNEEIKNITSKAEKYDAHLIFEKQYYNVNTNPNFGKFMKQIINDGLKVIALNGFATDYCVLAAGKALANEAEKTGKTLGKDFQIYIINDAICPTNINFQGKKDMEFGNKALTEIYSLGIKPITTKEILEDGLEKALEELENEI
jgi:nicotinamidase-related amidase